VSYYRTAQGHEVDFAVDPVTADGSLRLIQACTDIERADTVTREAQALDEAMAETGVSRATLVSLAASGELQMQNGTVEIVPFWEWALRRKI
jgi:predicted AAA+ superfamily ATPase